MSAPEEEPPERAGADVPGEDASLTDICNHIRQDVTALKSALELETKERRKADIAFLEHVAQLQAAESSRQSEVENRMDQFEATIKRWVGALGVESKSFREHLASIEESMTGISSKQDSAGSRLEQLDRTCSGLELSVSHIEQLRQAGDRWASLDALMAQQTAKHEAIEERLDKLSRHAASLESASAQSDEFLRAAERLAAIDVAVSNCATRIDAHDGKLEKLGRSAAIVESSLAQTEQLLQASERWASLDVAVAQCAGKQEAFESRLQQLSRATVGLENAGSQMEQLRQAGDRWASLDALVAQCVAKQEATDARVDKISRATTSLESARTQIESLRQASERWTSVDAVVTKCFSRQDASDSRIEQLERVASVHARRTEVEIPRELEKLAGLGASISQQSGRQDAAEAKLEQLERLTTLHGKRTEVDLPREIDRLASLNNLVVQCAARVDNAEKRHEQLDRTVEKRRVELEEMRQDLGKHSTLELAMTRCSAKQDALDARVEQLELSAPVRKTNAEMGNLQENLRLASLDIAVSQCSAKQDTLIERVQELEKSSNLKTSVTENELLQERERVTALSDTVYKWAWKMDEMTAEMERLSSGGKNTAQLVEQVQAKFSSLQGEVVDNIASVERTIDSIWRKEVLEASTRSDRLRADFDRLKSEVETKAAASDVAHLSARVGLDSPIKGASQQPAVEAVDAVEKAKANGVSMAAGLGSTAAAVGLSSSDVVLGSPRSSGKLGSLVEQMQAWSAQMRSDVERLDSRLAGVEGRVDEGERRLTRELDCRPKRSDLEPIGACLESLQDFRGLIAVIERRTESDRETFTACTASLDAEIRARARKVDLDVLSHRIADAERALEPMAPMLSLWASGAGLNPAGDAAASGAVSLSATAAAMAERLGVQAREVKSRLESVERKLCDMRDQMSLKVAGGDVYAKREVDAKLREVFSKCISALRGDMDVVLPQAPPPPTTSRDRVLESPSGHIAAGTGGAEGGSGGTASPGYAPPHMDSRPPIKRSAAIEAGTAWCQRREPTEAPAVNLFKASEGYTWCSSAREAKEGSLPPLDVSIATRPSLTSDREGGKQ